MCRLGSLSFLVLLWLCCGVLLFLVVVLGFSCPVQVSIMARTPGLVWLLVTMVPVCVSAPVALWRFLLAVLFCA